MNVQPRIPAAGWVHAQAWVVDVDQHKRRKSSPSDRLSHYSRRTPKAVMADSPPPVPPKDRRRSPTTSIPQITRRKVPASLQSGLQPQAASSQNSHLSVRGQAVGNVSYTYPPVNQVAPPEPTSAPSTRTEFADVATSSPSWHRPTELFLPQGEATQHISALERCVSPLDSPRVPSVLRRSVSTYTAADYSPSVYTPSVHSPPSATDLSRAATLRSQSTWIGPSPISPPGPREHWAQSSYPPAQREQRQDSSWTPSEEPFEDASQFHLFAEATAGLGPLVDHADMHKQQRNILSPLAARSGPPATSQTYPIPTNHDARAVSVPPQLPQEYYAPRVASSAQRRQTYVPGRPREAQELSEAFAEALTGFGPEGEVGPEDELPDYAQSQREAQQRQRRAAAQRAQELEQRWATARKAAQARGR